MRTFSKAGLALALLTAAAASAAVAQTPPLPASAPAVDGPARHHPDRAALSEHMQSRLREALQLRSDQDGALKAFVAGMMPEGPEHDRPAATRPDKDEALSSPARMERLLDRERERLAFEEKRLAALRTFYAALTPAQQKAFDALHRGMMHGEKGGAGRWGEGRGREEMGPPPGQEPGPHA